MKKNNFTPQELNHQVIRILFKELRPVNTIRFIQQYSTGSGDYTKERGEYFKNKSVAEIINEIKQRRKS